MGEPNKGFSCYVKSNLFLGVIIMMEKIVSFADKIIPFPWPSDKKAHYLVGLLIGLIGAFIFGASYAFFLGAAAALGKELYDEKDYGGFDWYDLGITLLGTVSGLVIYWVTIILLH
jgi:hypothetical protein